MSKEFKFKLSTNESIIRSTYDDYSKMFIQLVVKPDHIINVLFICGFRSDGVAYIIFLIAIVLSSNIIVVAEAANLDLNSIIIYLLEEIEHNTHLTNKANTFDEQIRKLRLKHLSGNIIQNFFRIKYRQNKLAEEFLNNSFAVTIVSQLNEIKKICLFYRIIFEANKKSINVSYIKSSMDVLRDMSNLSSSYEDSTLRIDFLKNFLWIMTENPSFSYNSNK